MSNLSVISLFNGFSTLWDFGTFIVTIGVLVTVHEFGHFWVARRCGVKVTCFSIGFGKKLWSRVDRHGTEFIIAMIPLGGYVKMLDGRIADVVPELQQYTFNNKSIGQRAAIISAGPIANFIFAILAYSVIYMTGVPTISPIVGEISSNSIAQQANISSNVELKSIAGIKTTDWSDVRLVLIGQVGKDDIIVSYSPVGSEQVETRVLNIHNWRINLDKEDPVKALGFNPRALKVTSVVDRVVSNSAAESAGLKANDRIISFNGQPFTEWDDFAKVIRESADKELSLQVERNNSVINIQLVVSKRTLADGSVEGFVGILPKREGLFTQQYNPIEATSKALGQTWLLTKVTVNSFGQLITGVFDLSNLAGPLSIAKGAGQSASYGFISYLTFLAFISISLGVINLFPLPVLDGGHLVFLLIEKIKGSPLSDTIQSMCFRVGSILLILLMGFTIFNDFSRI